MLFASTIFSVPSLTFGKASYKFISKPSLNRLQLIRIEVRKMKNSFCSQLNGI
jgi:hypothetical protein